MNKYLRGIVKKFIVPKLKFACIVRLVIDQRLVVVHQLFIWTAVRPSICRQNHRFARQSDSLSSSLSATYIIKRLFQNQFFPKWLNFQTKHWKKNNRAFKKISLVFFKLFYNQRLSSIHELLSWISVLLSRSPTDKMMGAQYLPS